MRHSSSDHFPEPSWADPFLHSLMRTSMIMFSCPRTTRCSRTGSMTQYIHIYIYTLLGLSFLQLPLKILLFCFSRRKEDFNIYHDYPTFTIRHLYLHKHIFNCPTHTLDASAFGTRPQLIFATPCSPHSTVWCGSRLLHLPHFLHSQN